MSKTLQLIRDYQRFLVEQDVQDPTQGQEAPPEQTGSVIDNPAPAPQETMPLSSAGEDKYISDLIDAALFEPSTEQANTLLNLQSQMKMKKYTNAREEILPSILGIIASSTSGGDLRKQLNSIESV